METPEDAQSLLLELADFLVHQKKPILLDATGQWVLGRTKRISVRAYLDSLKRQRAYYEIHRAKLLTRRRSHVKENREVINAKSRERSTLSDVKAKRCKNDRNKYRRDPISKGNKVLKPTQIPLGL